MVAPPIAKATQANPKQDCCQHSHTHKQQPVETLWRFAVGDDHPLVSLLKNLVPSLIGMPIPDSASRHHCWQGILLVFIGHSGHLLTGRKALLRDLKPWRLRLS